MDPDDLLIAKQNRQTSASPDDMELNDFVAPVGPAVEDNLLTIKEEASIHSDKVLCEDAVVLGGGASNDAAQMQGFGVPVRPILLNGSDTRSKLLTDIALQQFPEAIILPWMTKTRRSFWINGQCLTVRTSIATPRPPLPAVAAQTIAQAKVVTLAPLSASAADYDFACDVLSRRKGKKTILKLSNEQATAADGQMAFALAEQAWLTVVNTSEMQAWVHTHDIEEGVRRIRERVKNVIVTHANGVLGYVDSQRINSPRFVSNVPGDKIRATGDCWVGTFAALTALDHSPRVAAVFALAAACLHVENDVAGSRNLCRLAAIVASRATVSRPASTAKPAPSPRTWSVPAAATAASLAWIIFFLRLSGVA